METFYDQWLATGDRIEEEFHCSPMIAHDRELPWVRTRQDARVKLMVSNELGYPTMGGSVMKGEIRSAGTRGATCTARSPSTSSRGRVSA